LDFGWIIEEIISRIVVTIAFHKAFDTFPCPFLDENMFNIENP